TIGFNRTEQIATTDDLSRDGKFCEDGTDARGFAFLENHLAEIGIHCGFRTSDRINANAGGLNYSGNAAVEDVDVSENARCGDIAEASRAAHSHIAKRS